MSDLRIVGQKTSSHDETWKPVYGKQKGRIQIQKVNTLSSTAKLLEGQGERGAVLEPVKK